MFRFSKVPLLRILIPLILGVVVGSYLQVFLTISVQKLLSCAAILLFGTLVLQDSQQIKSFSQRWQFGLLSSVILFLIGIIYHQQFNQKASYSFENVPTTWVGQLKTIDINEDGAANYKIELNRLQTSNGWKRVHFAMLLYSSKPKLNFQVGDLLTGHSYLNKIAAPLNPAAFNYAKFCANRKIYYQTFSNDIQFLQHNNSLQYYASFCRKTLISWFAEMGINGDELAVLSALSLGDKSNLSPELKGNYAAAGAMHILAVSGLHVGIIYLLFTQLFKRFDRTTWQRLIKAIFLLLIIWTYAMLTGFSPSVQRAGCMFSFIIISSALKRHSNIINSIAGSALLLILINPNIVFEVGFQLSYAAVVGIVLIHPAIYPLFNLKFWLVDKAWSLMVVSMAAQLATLPFAIFYFHQFPNWFLLVNLFVIPLAFAIVSGAIIVALVWGIFHHDFFLGKALNLILEFLNWVVSTAQSLPYAVTENIWLNSFSLAFLFLALIFMVYYILEKRPKLLMFSFSALFIVIAIESTLDVVQSKRSYIGFYAFENSPIAFVNGLEAEVYIADTSYQYYQKRTISDHLHREGVRLINWVNNQSPQKSSQLFQRLKLEHGTILNGLNQKVLLLNDTPVLPEFLNESWICIMNNKIRLSDNLFENTTTEFIFDSGIKSWSTQHMQLAEKYHVRLMSEGGYFQQDEPIQN